MAGIVDASEVLTLMGLGDSATDVERAVVQYAITASEGAVKRFLGYDPVKRERTEYYPQADQGGYSGDGVWISEGSFAVFRAGTEASTSELFVRHIPIRSITSLAIDWDGRSDTKSGAYTDVKTEGTDFWPNYDGLDSDNNQICHDGIIRSIGRWPTNPNTIKIKYYGGYDEDELHGQDTKVDASPIWESVINEAIRRARYHFSSAKGRAGFLPGNLVSERLGDYQYRLSDNFVNVLFSGINDLLPETKERLSESFVNWPYRIAG